MRTFIPFYAGTPRANHRKTEAFVMDCRVDTGWPTRVAANELPLEADLIVRFLYRGITGQYYRRAVTEPVAEHMSVEKVGTLPDDQLAETASAKSSAM
jgi:hypothetical protein